MNDVTVNTDMNPSAVGNTSESAETVPCAEESIKNVPSDADTQEKDEHGALAELALRIDELEKKLSERERTPERDERMSAEMSDFARFFPDVRADEIPESVWERVRGGESLAGSFALYRYARERENRRVSEYNEANGKMSAGSLSPNTQSSYYSPDEVRKMSRRQIKEHYDDVIESMRHWN